MKNSPIILSLLIFCHAFCFAQQPYVQNLEGVAQITFPAKPKSKPVSIGKVYTLHKGILYLAQVIPVTKSSTDMLNQHLTDSVYEGIITGYLGNKGKLLARKKIKLNGLDGLEILIRAPLDSQITYRYHQMYYFNDKLIAYGIWSSDSVKRENNTLISGYFNSFKITLPASKLVQGNTHNNTAYASGQIAGRILAIFAIIIIIAALGLGIVLLIKKLVYRN